MSPTRLSMLPSSGSSQRTITKRLLQLTPCLFFLVHSSAPVFLIRPQFGPCERGTESGEGRLCLSVRNSLELTRFELFRIANTLLPDIKMEQSRSQSFGQSFKGELS